MTTLTPLASALHAKVWPLVARKAQEYCETIEQENVFMNQQCGVLAPYLLETPLPILACIWGVHPSEAEQWREEVRAALAREAM